MNRLLFLTILKGIAKEPLPTTHLTKMALLGLTTFATEMESSMNQLEKLSPTLKIRKRATPS